MSEPSGDLQQGADVTDGRQAGGRGQSAPREWSENMRFFPRPTLWIDLNPGKRRIYHSVSVESAMGQQSRLALASAALSSSHHSVLLFVVVSCRAWLQSLGSARRERKSRSSETVLACPLVEAKGNVSCPVESAWNRRAGQLLLIVTATKKKEENK